MDHQCFSLSEFKALNSKDEPGSFEGLVAVFGNVDYGGDRIQRGAFKRTLSEWQQKGRSIPVLWSHDSETVPIGVVNTATEGVDGLRVKARLFVDDHPQARAVYAAMKGGALHEFSFGFGVREKKDVVENGQQVRILKDLDLAEVSPVFRGMNPATRLMGVKKLGDELTDLQAKHAGLIADAESHEQDAEGLRTQAADVEQQITDIKAAQAVITDLPEETTPPEPGGKEHEDKPEHKPDEGEDAQARIRALQISQPMHLE